MLPVYQVATGGGITEEELPGSVVHFPQPCQEPPLLTSHLSFLVASSRATADSELWRTLLKGKPWAQAVLHWLWEWA